MFPKPPYLIAIITSKSASTNPDLWVYLKGLAAWFNPFKFTGPIDLSYQSQHANLAVALRDIGIYVNDMDKDFDAIIKIYEDKYRW